MSPIAHGRPATVHTPAPAVTHCSKAPSLHRSLPKKVNMPLERLSIKLALKAIRAPRVDMATVKEAINNNNNNNNNKDSGAKTLSRSTSSGHLTVLLDTRARDEYIVSRIPGAVNAETIEEVLALPGINKDTRIICYCSVGYRSAKMTKQLRHAGFQRVYNYEGSIFEWAEQGGELENTDKQEVHHVHPFNVKWGRLLRSDLHYSG
eukprot:TRINITY_DN414_c0_g1_i1.p1 TRINITY_DN414_c0_g1~~TRINITY_DN414_c0_g1_i1.p1  ORF type:complete len:206 (+),score=44.88 TRINITY_DN414_c0_g1_i1:326-943(+)